MSRDWTPREQYNIDKVMTKENNGNSFRDSLLTMNWVVNGVEKPIYSEEQRQVLSMFRELGFLWSDSLLDIWKRTEVHPIRRKRVLMSIEEELEKIIEMDDLDKSLDGFNTVLVSWYYGKLDTSFYYNEENNASLKNYIYKLIMQEKRK